MHRQMHSVESGRAYDMDLLWDPTGAGSNGSDLIMRGAAANNVT